MPKTCAARKAMAQGRRLAARWQAIRPAGFRAWRRHRTPCPPKVRTMWFEATARRSRLPSLAGCALSKCVRRVAGMAARLLTTRWPIYATGGAGNQHRESPVRGLLMEGAMNKNYDILNVPIPENCWCPVRASGGRCTDHAVGRGDSRSTSSWLCTFIRRVRSRSIATYLTAFPATPGSAAGGTLDIPPNSVAETEGYQVLAIPGAARKFSAAHAPARRRAMLLEAILPDGTKRTLRTTSIISNFQLDDQLHLRGRRGSGAARRAP